MDTWTRKGEPTDAVDQPVEHVQHPTKPGVAMTQTPPRVRCWSQGSIVRHTLDGTTARQCPQLRQELKTTLTMNFRWEEQTCTVRERHRDLDESQRLWQVSGETVATAQVRHCHSPQPRSARGVSEGPGILDQVLRNLVKASLHEDSTCTLGGSPRPAKGTRPSGRKDSCTRRRLVTPIPVTNRVNTAALM